jgi:hypothetical protein
MSKLHVNHIKVRIQKFKDKIDISDMTGRPQQEQDQIILTRGLAAYSLHILRVPPRFLRTHTLRN